MEALETDPPEDRYNDNVRMSLHGSPPIDHATAPGTEPPRQVRGTPGVYVFLAGVGYGFVMGIALTLIFS